MTARIGSHGFPVISKEAYLWLETYGAGHHELADSWIRIYNCHNASLLSFRCFQNTTSINNPSIYNSASYVFMI